MLKWFSVSGIIAEIKRIRWSSPKKLATDVMVVIIFVSIFALFFAIFTMFNAWFLNDILGI
ncbi:MAG: preprotein translocase subunit SecE [Breznakia sp.]